ncbi:MAG: hypothetical protein CVU50_10105 [Candidatus Cloacimonetes bacterium HGW-Cloacimonetes-3]|jgi:hypothetical protein|nr:MAG: hypothetical protein CVU50_10105 [Candidatus Cloacimonetes bacterium HGW-Cloacimonetes-3]
MKARMQFGMTPISGKAGELVFCYNRRTGGMYAREYKYPTLTENHHKMGGVARNLFAVKPADDFKYDCRTYAYLYANSRKNRGVKIWTWSNCYLHLMYALAKAQPEIDLSTLTREEIYAQDLPCISIKRAVEAGLLEQVDNYNRLDSQI